MNLKKIDKPVVELRLTVDEAYEYNYLVDKHTFKRADVTEKGNECPRCGFPFYKDWNYCPQCGQATLYNESDIVPFKP